MYIIIIFTHYSLSFLTGHTFIMPVERFDLAYYPYLVGVLLVICTCSFLLNTITMVTFHKAFSFPTPSHYLVLSMVVDDWLRTVFVLPVTIYGNHVYWWTLSQWYCHYYGFASTFLGLNSMIHLTALALDRWRKISNPFAVRPDTKDGKIIVLGLWLFTLAWSILPLIGWSSYSQEPGYSGCSVTWYSTKTTDQLYIICLFIVFFFSPILINLFCYISIYLHVKTLSQNDIRRWGENAPATKESLKAKIKSTKMAFSMIMGFLFAWSPYAIVSLCTTFGHPVSPLVTTLAAIFAKTSSMYNPVILVIVHKNFRKTLKTFWTKLFHCKKKPQVINV